MNSLSRKIISLCAATTLACAGAGFAAPAAFADTFEPVIANLTPAATLKLDPTAPVTLKIRKYVGETGDTTTGLDGVTYEVVKVKDSDGTPFDLTKNESWERFNTLVKKNNISELIPGLAHADGANVHTVTTQNGGQIDLELTEGAGIYRVTETGAPAGYSVTAPFLVSLPDMDKSNGNWVYERTVEPKNQKIEPTKAVDDNAATLGGELGYRLTSRIPSSALAEYKVVDPLVANLQYKAGSLGVALVSEKATVASATIPTLESADYVAGLPTAPGGEVTVEFTTAGRKKLKDFYDSYNDAQVQVDFKTTVVSLPADGKIENTATFTINGHDYTTDKEQPGGGKLKASTTFADVELTKSSTSDGVTADDLKKATFDLYRCVQNGQNWDLKGTPLKTASAADSTTTQDFLTTTPEAKAVGFGVPVSSTSTDDSGTDTQEFCVIETKAPEGFVKNPEIFHLDKSTPAAGERMKLTADIDNQKTTFLNQLPSTGAWGIVLVFLLGFLLLARGLYTTRRDGQATA